MEFLNISETAPMFCREHIHFACSALLGEQGGNFGERREQGVQLGPRTWHGVLGETRAA